MRSPAAKASPRCSSTAAASCWPEIRVPRTGSAGDLPTRRSSKRCWQAPPARSPPPGSTARGESRSEEHTSELQSRRDLVCRLLLEKKKKKKNKTTRKKNKQKKQEQ